MGMRVGCSGVRSRESLGMANFDGRMGRVVEMNGRQYMEDGTTELCTVLLDSRVGDYDQSSGVWVGVPLANLKEL